MARHAAPIENDPGFEAVELMAYYPAPGFSAFFPSPWDGALRDLDDFAGRYGPRLVENGMVRCLADLLLAWLCYGNATRYCPTFELYLKTAIYVIDLWSGDDETYRSEQIDCIPLRDPRTPEHPCYEQHARIWWVNDTYVLSTLVREGSTATIFTHPAFDSSYYEVNRVERQLANWEITYPETDERTR